MQPWLITLLFVLGFFLMIGLIRAISRRSQFGWEFDSFMTEFFLLDVMGDALSNSGGSFDGDFGGLD